MKTHILPPSRVTAFHVVAEVAPGYQHWRAIVSEVQRDLLRFAALISVRVSVDPFTHAACFLAGRQPVFHFPIGMVNSWLDRGGRAWLLAELEARSPKRVIAFPRNRGRS